MADDILTDDTRQRANSLLENVSDSLPVEIRRIEDLDQAIKELEDHARAMKAVRAEAVNIPIPIPFSMIPAQLYLDGATLNHTRTKHPMEFIVDDVSWDDEEEMERIFRSAVVLYHKLNRIDNQPTTFRDCLDTAIVWERG